MMHAWDHKNRECAVVRLATVSYTQAGYEQRQAEILYVIPFLVGTPRIHVASPEVVKELLTNLKDWTKPELGLSLKCVTTCEYQATALI